MEKNCLIIPIELKNFDGGSIFSVLCNEEIEFKIEFKSIFGNAKKRYNAIRINQNVIVFGFDLANNPE